MLIGVAHKAGRSDKTIVCNANNCHPHMANDGFAGTAVLIRLMQWLVGQDTFYSYRLVIAPEHLGSVFYLRDLPREEVDRIGCGIFEGMPGTGGAIVATAPIVGGPRIDRVFPTVSRPHAQQYRKGSGGCGGGTRGAG